MVAKARLVVIIIIRMIIVMSRERLAPALSGHFLTAQLLEGLSECLSSSGTRSSPTAASNCLQPAHCNPFVQMHIDRRQAQPDDCCWPLVAGAKIRLLDLGLRVVLKL